MTSSHVENQSEAADSNPMQVRVQLCNGIDDAGVHQGEVQVEQDSTSQTEQTDPAFVRSISGRSTRSTVPIVEEDRERIRLRTAKRAERVLCFSMFCLPVNFVFAVVGIIYAQKAQDETNLDRAQRAVFISFLMDMIGFIMTITIVVIVTVSVTLL